MRKGDGRLFGVNWRKSILAVRDFKDPKDPFLMIVSVIRFRERMVMK